MFFVSMKKIFIKYPTLLKLLPSSFKNNKEFMWSIINQNPQCFEYASAILKNDVEFILSFFVSKKEQFIIGFNGENLQHLLEKRQRHLFLKYCSDDLKNNLNFIYRLLTHYEYENDYHCLEYLPYPYLNSLAFWIKHIENNGFYSLYHLALEESEVLKNITIKIDSYLSHPVALPLSQIHDIELLKEYCQKNKEIHYD